MGTRFLLLSIFLVTTSCQVYNSASRDKLLYGSGIDPDSNFGKAFAVITSRCLSCHAQFGTWTTEAQWISYGYVTASNLSESKVYYRLYGANLGIDKEDMPTNSALTSSELADVRNWILNL